MSVKCSEVVNYNISLSYYKLLKQMFEELVKYIKGYKTFTYEYYRKILDFQFKYGTKLTKPTENFQNASWINSLHIIKLSSKIPQIIHLQIENINSFITGVEKIIKPLDDFFKDKSLIIKKWEKKYEEANDNLIKKYIDVEKVKNNYLNSMNKTEDIVNKYYERICNESDKSKIKEYENQMKNYINSSKKIENDYKNTIENSIKNEAIFVNVINECIHEIKNIATDVSEKMKEVILYFFVSIKNSFKLPLSELEILLPHLTDVDEKREMDKIMTETFNTGSNLIHIKPNLYSLKILNLNEKENDNNNDNNNNIIINEKIDNNLNNKSKNCNSKKKKIIQILDDGIEEISYFEDDATLKAIIEFKNNFEFIDLGNMDIKLEEEKNITKNYINMIIKNISNYDKNIEINNEEITEIKELLTRHENRIIFLHKLNDYRVNGQLELKSKNYKLLGNLFSYIVDQFKKDNTDFHSMELIIILSQTYFMNNFNNQKEYLQLFIEDNEVFKSKNFWEKYTEYSINKEIIRNKNIEKNGIENNESKKMNNIVFAQSLNLIDNMVDFGLEKEMIKEILEPKMIEYKLTDNLKYTIYGVIQNKIANRQNNEEGENNNDISNYITNELYGED